MTANVDTISVVNSKRRLIHYSQCWEDPKTMLNGLKVNTGDDIIAIGSGGDNSFALLLENPRSITVVDSNPAQMNLVELKIRAIQNLNYSEFLGFLGVKECNSRIDVYGKLRPFLSPEVAIYWDNCIDNISMGVINIGKFERFFALFRNRVLPLIHKDMTVERFLACRTMSEQKNFFDDVWNNRRWRFLIRVFFSKFVMGHLGRDPSYYEHVGINKTSEEILKRTQHGLTEVNMDSNFFVEYILTGRYRNPDYMPPYLLASNFDFLKKNCGKLKLIHNTITEYFSQLKPCSVSKFYLSDVFEYISQCEFEEALVNIARVSRADSRLAFWTLFINRCIPDRFSEKFKLNYDLSRELTFSSRTFFYNNFNVWLIL